MPALVAWEEMAATRDALPRGLGGSLAPDGSTGRRPLAHGCTPYVRHPAMRRADQAVKPTYNED